MTRCSNCGTEVPPDDPGSERQPCPKCGSLARTHEASGSLSVGVSVSSGAAVERGVNDARIAAFAVIFTTVVGVGMTVGFATCVLLGVLAAIVTAAATALMLAAVYRLRVVRHVVMELMHRITGQ